MNWRKNKAIKKILRNASRYQVSIILALVGLALIGAGLSVTKFVSGSRQPQFVSGSSEGEASSRINVDIEGAINQPGVYTLASGARVSDAINQAGDLAKNADQSWIAQNLNLAAKLSDGQKIYIPALGDAGKVVSETAGKININTASAGQLDQLPDIGPVRAEKIIAGRPYVRAEDPLTKKIVGESTFEKIKDKIAVY